MNLQLLNINLFIYNFLLSFVTVILVVVAVAFFTLLERKVLAAIQRRRGPNFVGFWGVLQAFSDALKLLFKEISVPSGANFFFYLLSPISILTLSLTLWGVMPFSGDFTYSSLNYSIFFIFIVSTLNVYGLILSGMASNSRYALIGGVRSAAQMISYEIPMSICLMGISLITNSFNVINIVSFQSSFLCFVLSLPFLIIFLICMFAETNRTPFDLPEAEAEIVAGYNTEYSAILFSFYFLAEYSNIMFGCFFIVLMFFGGHGIFFFMKVLLLMLFFIFIRGILPRYRYSQLMGICWKMLLPISISYFYLLIMVFFLFKLGNSNYDENISEMVRVLLEKDCLEGCTLLVLAAVNKNWLLNNGVADGLMYKKLFFFFLASLFFVLLLTLITWILVSKKKNNTKASSYECGYEPIGAPTARFEIHFYIISILFIIFDVEVLFLYPWIIGVGRLPIHAFFTLTIFLAILFIGYGYEWLKGTLDWAKEPVDTKRAWWE